MSKPTITRNEYLQVLGLLQLSLYHYNMLVDITKAVAVITGEENDGFDYYGHVSDTVWSGNQVSADEMLHIMEIKVSE